MKKVASLLVASLAAFGASAVNADSANSAEIATDQFCQCATCGNALGTSPLQTFDARAVKTSSGNVTLQCHFDVPQGFAPSKALRPVSTGCGTPFGSANKIDIVISPGGQAKLTCQVSPSAD